MHALYGPDTSSDELSGFALYSRFCANQERVWQESSDFGDIRRGWLRSLFKMAIDASAAGALAM